MILLIDILIGLVLLVSGVILHAKNYIGESLVFLLAGGLWAIWIISIWRRE